MKKIKKKIPKLIPIIIVALIILILLILIYNNLFKSSSSSRFKDLDKYELTDNEVSDIKSTFDNLDNLNKVSVYIKSKIIRIYLVLNDDVEYKVLEFSLNMDEKDNIRSLYFIIYEDMSNVSCYQIVYKDGKTDVNKMEDDFLKDYDQVELNQKNIYLDQFLAILEKVNFKKYKNANIYTYTYNKFDDNLINYDEVYKIDKNNNLKESNKSNDKKLQYIKCIAENNESTVKRVIYLISDK